MSKNNDLNVLKEGDTVYLKDVPNGAILPELWAQITKLDDKTRYPLVICTIKLVTGQEMKVLDRHICKVTNFDSVRDVNTAFRLKEPLSLEQMMDPNGILNIEDNQGVESDESIELYPEPEGWELYEENEDG